MILLCFWWLPQVPFNPTMIFFEDTEGAIVDAMQYDENYEVEEE